MTSAEANVLLLAADGIAEELAELAAPRTFAHHTEPYEALEELARRRYDAVVVAEGCGEVAGLARAVRRLGPGTRTYLLCSPAGEAELHGDRPEALADYFVFPPAPEDIDRIFRASPAAPQAEAERPEAAGVALAASDIASLVESAYSLDGLCGYVKTLVTRWTGLDVEWVDAADASRHGEALLLLDADPPRVLQAMATQGLPAEVHHELHTLQVLLGPLAAQVRRTAALHQLAITDHLTGAYNRRYFYHLTDQLLARARAERFRVTLLLYDIDDFKRYNDTYGHAAGDEVLRDTVLLMKSITRDRDIVARIGGDEFAVLFWDAEPPRRPDSQHPQTATALASRFCQAIEKHRFTSLGTEAVGVLTISGGLATYPWDGQTCRELLSQADKGLAQAKRSGKNAIHLVGEGPVG